MSSGTGEYRFYFRIMCAPPPPPQKKKKRKKKRRKIKGGRGERERPPPFTHTAQTDVCCFVFVFAVIL